MSTEIDRVFRALTTVKEMIHDRGMDTAAFERFSPAEVATCIQEQEMIDLHIGEGGAFRIVFVLNPKPKWGDIGKQLGDNQHLMVVTKTPLTTTTEKSARANLRATFVEFFNMTELQFNITHNELVPKHELITNREEILKLLEQYKLKTKADMPRITRDDPMARYLCAKPEQIVCITRYTPTSGLHTYYRICV
jgi:DNA-directed RNA polymerase subunit H (RpoH/RPB5)